MSKSILINEQEAQTVRHEIAAAAEALEDTVGWIQMLKLAAREARITGIDHEKYFVLAYDLALEHGYLEVKSGWRVIATDVFWREFVEAGEPSVDDVRRELSDQAFVAELAGILDQEWVDGRRFQPNDHEAAEMRQLGKELLDLFGPHLEILDAPRATQLWESISCHGAVDSWHDRANQLGLTATDFPPKPALLHTPRGAEQPLPLDRSVQDRVNGILGHGDRSRRSGLPPARQILLDETQRSCEPLGLGTRYARAVMLLGVYLSFGFSLDGAKQAKDMAQAARNGQTRATITLNRRLYRNSALYKAAEEGRLNGSIQSKLEDPSASYLVKLWTRVHGREARGHDLTDPREVWFTLSNVGTGVLMDIVGMQKNHRPLAHPETITESRSSQRAEAPPSSSQKFQFDNDARGRIMPVLRFAAGAVGQASLGRFMNDVINDPDPQHQAALAQTWDGWRKALVEETEEASNTDGIPAGNESAPPTYAEAAAFFRVHLEGD